MFILSGETNPPKKRFKGCTLSGYMRKVPTHGLHKTCMLLAATQRLHPRLLGNVSKPGAPTPLDLLGRSTDKEPAHIIGRIPKC